MAYQFAIPAINVSGQFSLAKDIPSGCMNNAKCQGDVVVHHKAVHMCDQEKVGG